MVKPQEVFLKDTFLRDDLAYCNEIRSAIEITISESSNKINNIILFS